MAELFFTYLRISFLAGVMILAILLLRPLLRKAPRNIACVLWLLVAVRLLFPFDVQSPLSLQPRQMSEPVTVTAPAQREELPSPLPELDELPVYEELPVTDVQPQQTASPAPGPGITVEPETVVAVIWLCGTLTVLLYAAVSYGILKYRVRDAVRCLDGALESHRIGDAFLLGYFRPRIYLPAGLSTRDRELIVSHELAHKKRADHWWKLLGLLCLSIHWYNPLVWLGYALLCRDIEVACDEKVIGGLELDARKDYSLALLNTGKRMSGFLTYPVAFGEVSLKQRIKGVLSYRKPTLWITAAAITLTVAVAVCFMTTPAAKAQPEVTDPLQTTTEPNTEDMTAPTTEETTEETTTPTTEPTIPAAQPTESTQPAATEPTLPTEPVTTTPTEPPATVPEQSEPTVPPATEPSQPAPVEPPTQPPVTEPAQPEITVPPATVPTNPPDTEPVQPEPTAPDREKIGGNCGENVVWEYDAATGQLKISGQGAMDAGEQPGWKAYGDGITSVVIGEGVTSISPYAFSGCKSLKTVRLPTGLQRIDEFAFAWSGLRKLTIPKTMTKIECRAFWGCQALTRITFTGSPPEIYKDAFSSVTATAYFPEQSGQWRYAQESYGGDLTWELCCTNHSYINGVCERCGVAKP